MALAFWLFVFLASITGAVLTMLTPPDDDE